MFAAQAALLKESGLILYPKVQVLGLAMYSAFELANNLVGRAEYQLHLLSEHGGAVQTSAAFAVDTSPLMRRGFDTLMVMGDSGQREISTSLVDYLRDGEATVRRLGSICKCAYMLAHAGLLNGRAMDASVTATILESRLIMNEGTETHSEISSRCVALMEDGVLTSMGCVGPRAWATRGI